MKAPAILHCRLPNQALAWLCVALLLLSLTPLYALSFYNHACYDDFGFSIRTHDAWRATGSLWQTIRAAAENTAIIRGTWEGTYTTSFISALQPALFGENLYWVATVVLLTFFLFALWFFLRQVLVKGLGVDKTTFWLALCAVSFVMIQFVPELSESFFWFNGGVAYTLMWSLMLVRYGVMLCHARSQRSARRAAWFVLLLALSLLMGGAKYSTVLFSCCVDGLIVLYGLVRGRKGRWERLAAFALMLGGLVFSALAPGNAVRAATLHGGMSAPKAILQALYFGVALMGHWFSLPLLVVWALVGWRLWDALRGCRLKFAHPVWITLLSVGLFCAQLAPTLYTGNYLGDGRTVNTYFYTFVLLSCALALYWLGWGLRRWEKPGSCPAIQTSRKGGLRWGTLLAALALLVIGCISYKPDGAADYGLRNLSGGSALRSLLTGQVARYDRAMDQRDEEMNDPSQPEAVLRPVEDIPDAFMGDAAQSDNPSYVKQLYAEYYQKLQVTLAGEEENHAAAE